MLTDVQTPFLGTPLVLLKEEHIVRDIACRATLAGDSEVSPTSSN